MKKIYFDTVHAMERYGEDYYKTVQESLRACPSAEGWARWLVVECINKIRNYQDLKVVLALVYNYMPCKYNYLDDYEAMAFLIAAYANGSINEDEFYSKTGIRVGL